MPVLPGLVVTVAAGRAAINEAAAILRRAGPGKARIGLDGLVLDAQLRQELVGAAELGEQLVVRSSTTLDERGEWAGAFSSFGEISAAELPTAVRGCWSSVFSRDCLARFERVGLPPQAVGMAVLIQRQLNPEAGGWAHVEADGPVTVAGRAGEPAPLLSGMDSGVRGSIGSDGSLNGQLAELPVDRASLRELAAACRSVLHTLGMDRTEWAIEHGRPWILQASRSPAAPLVDRAFAIAGHRLSASSLAPYRRLAGLLAGRRGRLADQLIAPWAAARLASREEGPDRTLDAASQPADHFQVAIAAAETLSRDAERATSLTRPELLTGLARGNPGIAHTLDDVILDAATARFVVETIDDLGRILAAAGRLPNAGSIWRQDPTWVDEALAGGGRPATHAAPDRWQDLLWRVVTTSGREYTGSPASAGRAVGRIASSGRLAGSTDEPWPSPGRVLTLRHPTPDHGPQLWDALGLVTELGSPGAHLCQIARSLHLPAVVGVAVGDAPLDLTACGSDAVVGLDGDTGSVWVARLADLGCAVDDAQMAVQPPSTSSV